MPLDWVSVGDATRRVRVAFLCSALQPGCDGVGDYTRGLAVELNVRGHQTLVVSMNDKYVSSAATELQSAPGGDVQVLRLPTSEPWSNRERSLASALSQFDPTYISLQFVAYGFNRYGIAFGLGQRLKRIIGERWLHLMFHELWIGAERNTTVKNRAIGYIQRRSIQAMVKTLAPTVIHTSNEAYRALLQSTGISSGVLPMFGSIPVSEQNNTQWMEFEVSRGLDGPYRRTDWIIFGMFGALHSQWPPEPLLPMLSRAGAACGKKVAVASIGRIGQAGEHLWSRMSRQYETDVSFIRLGEQPAATVAEFLHYIDWGIATTPRQIIGKSSTVAAMLECGLPVIVNREDADFRIAVEKDDETLLFRCDKELARRIIQGGVRGKSASRRELAAKQLLAELLMTSAEIGHET